MSISDEIPQGSAEQDADVIARKKRVLNGTKLMAATTSEAEAMNSILQRSTSSVELCVGCVGSLGDDRAKGPSLGPNLEPFR